MRKTISFFAGVLAGALVGSVAALLLTPDSGSHIQEQLQTRAQRLIDEGRKAAAAQRAEMAAQLEAFKRGTPITLEPANQEPEA
jgi:gas vesicle protein